MSDLQSLLVPNGDKPTPRRYRAFYTKYDEVVNSWDLAHPDELSRLLAAQRLKVPYSQEELEKAVSRIQFPKGTATSLLKDLSGSTRGAPNHMNFQISRSFLALSTTSAQTMEICGFTTKHWKSGEAYRDWLEQGQPTHPGRLNGLRHIVFKPFNETVRAEHETGMAIMVRDGLLKDNIDGEAIVWAASRLQAQDAKNKVLVVQSDNGPYDDMTPKVNGKDLRYFQRHLDDVCDYLNQKTDINLVHLHHDAFGHRSVAPSESLSQRFKRRVMLDLRGFDTPWTLTLDRAEAILNAVAEMASYGPYSSEGQDREIILGADM